MLNIEILLKSHVILGNMGIILLLGMIIAVKSGKLKSARWLSVLSSLSLILCSIAGGYWYIVYYPGPRKLLKASQYSWAHRFFMEVKEHIFFQVLLLALVAMLLLFADDEKARQMAVKTAWLAVAIAILVNVFGHVVNMGTTLVMLGHGG